MGKLSRVNMEKLEALKQKLNAEGAYIEESVPKESLLTNLNEDEKNIIKDTTKVWGVSLEQAAMIYKSCGSIKAMKYANGLKSKLNSNEITYSKLMVKLREDKALIDTTASLEEKYFTNYEQILSGDLFPAQTMLLRNTNLGIEKILAERRPKIPIARLRSDAIGPTIYYGMMFDLMKNDVSLEKVNARELEQSKVRPGMSLSI